MNRRMDSGLFTYGFKSGLVFKLIVLTMLLGLLPIGMAQAENPIEVYEVNFELGLGHTGWMWGRVEPYASVEVKKGETVLFEVTADSSGNWENPFPIEINPGDVFTVTAGAGLTPVDIEIPDPFTATASSTSDKVWGQIDHLDHELVEIFGYWESVYQSVMTDEYGNYFVTYVDIPNGGKGYVVYYTMNNYADIYYYRNFQTLDLILEVNYKNNWVQSHYEPGHMVWLTVYADDGTTVKATAVLETTEIPWWGGGTGFFTDLGDYWVPGRPDIQPGDWVYGLVDNGYDAWVRVGMITGEVDLDSDTISGTVDSSWLPAELVDVECQVWEEPGPDAKYDSIIPNGEDFYSCSWSGEWDLQSNHTVAVSYHDPGGYENPDGGQVQAGQIIYDVYYGYLDDLVMKIHSGYDWIEGFYAPGHEIHLTVEDGLGTVKATTTLTTGDVDEWEGRSGFASWLPGTVWVPEPPDIQPGDVILAEVDDGENLFGDELKIGLITGEVDASADDVSGTIDAEVNWTIPGAVTVNVGCYIWQEFGPENKFDSVVSDGSEVYQCSWSGEWDILRGLHIQVAYFEPEGHEIIQNFFEPYLIHLPLMLR